MNLHSRSISSLQGVLTVPGDKSISHRAAILGGLADGVTEVDNFLCSEDCLNTLRAMEQLGAWVEVLESREGCGPVRFRITGVAMRPHSPSRPIDCGNSGTGMRLLAGMLAACPFDSEMFGDASLSSRPMGRIMSPLEQMGAKIEARGSKPGCAPLFIHAGHVRPISYTLPMASAQVKSAILLAGMFAEGITTVIQPAVTRDHTERLFRHFGVPCSVDGLVVSTEGPALPRAHDLTVPADISSAAFWMVAAATRPGSRLTLRQVGLNESRCAVISALRRMGAQMDIVKTSPEDAGEPYGDITIYGADSLHGTALLPEEIPNLIDEIPILAVAGALSDGDLVVRNARELRVKETDRIATTAANLRAMGATVEEFDDGMIVRGGADLKGAELPSYGDHRIAMSFLVAGFSACGETVLTDAGCINTSYPGFDRDLSQFLQ
ncbi:3-phosphoshikimate 1-carboxyvinyltransferase [Akkermansia sp.]|uniref:3-phosphoshikimate 1-carboxyvinyltransferase n=1 Tax=Akkermansia sp. TaxID=1872421 RepID=UPI0039967027